ncbi:MAG: flagellar basal-body rod protein FlgF [Pseudomonadota bacterium]
MENAMMVGLSRQMTLRRNMDVVANNLANMNTAGFKAEALLFQEYMSEYSGAAFNEDKLSFVLDRGVARDLTEGQLDSTGAPLDMAISGDGFFVVQTEAGERYTRNGHFGTDETGRLITREGDPVLDDAGQEIILNLEGGPITVAADGVISTGEAIVARLNIVTFENPAAMKKAGETLLATDEIPLPAEDARVAQGVLELSNVTPVLEITKMIDIMRSYQSVNKLMESSAELARKAVETLGKPK